VSVETEHDESGNTGDVGALIDVNAYGSPGAQDAARILRRARSGGKAEAEAKTDAKKSKGFRD